MIVRFVTVMVRPEDVAMRPLESVTLIVTGNVPSLAATGVPVKLTLLVVLAARESQEGAETMAHVKGPTPPVSLIVAE